MTGEAAAKTTVVIPAWDAYVGPQLEEAVNSVAAQGTPVCVVVVDNASDVPLPALGGCDVVRSRRRLALGAARNLGLEAAQTPYCVCWDADDVMLPGALALLEAALDADPRLAAYGAGIVESPSGQRHRWPRRWLARLVRWPRLLALLDCVWSQYPTTGATIMRTALVRDAGGYYDADSGDDWCLGVALAFRGRIGWTERPGRVYRRHPGSIWDRYGGPRHQLRHAAQVRAQLRRDPRAPRWLRRLTPLVAAAQLAAIAAHAAVVAIRRSRAG